MEKVSFVHLFASQKILINLQIDIFSQQLLLIPFHLGVHWATVVVDFAAKEIV